MNSLLWVMIGGAVGSGLRYGIGTAIQTRSGSDFPLGTLTVNLVGCLLIGFLAAYFTASPTVRPEVRLGIVVGCLGGFTTFSSFGFETLQLLQSGRWTMAGAYVLASNVAGLGLAWLGWTSARTLFTAE